MRTINFILWIVFAAVFGAISASFVCAYYSNGGLHEQRRYAAHEIEISCYDLTQQRTTILYLDRNDECRAAIYGTHGQVAGETIKIARSDVDRIFDLAVNEVTDVSVDQSFDRNVRVPKGVSMNVEIGNRRFGVQYLGYGNISDVPGRLNVIYLKLKGRLRSDFPLP